MGLPAYSKDDLIKAARRDEIIRETAAQIIKDFGEFNLDISFSGNPGTFYEELSLQMTNHVDELIQRNHSRFMGLLYRIDISATDITNYEIEMTGFEYSQIITELIIHRELKKVLTRDYFRQQNQLKNQ